MSLATVQAFVSIVFDIDACPLFWTTQAYIYALNIRKRYSFTQSCKPWFYDSNATPRIKLVALPACFGNKESSYCTQQHFCKWNMCLFSWPVNTASCTLCKRQAKGIQCWAMCRVCVQWLCWCCSDGEFASSGNVPRGETGKNIPHIHTRGSLLGCCSDTRDVHQKLLIGMRHSLQAQDLCRRLLIIECLMLICHPCANVCNQISCTEPDDTEKTWWQMLGHSLKTIKLMWWMVIHRNT